MSDEITIGVNASVSKSGIVRSLPFTSATIDQTTAARGGQSQNLTTAWEDIDTGDVTEGYIFLSHVDGTIQWGPEQSGSASSAEICGTLIDGDPPASFHLTSGVTLKARASTGTARVDVEIWSV